MPIDAVDVALFAAATRVTVRNGRKASFWKSSWLHGKAPAYLFPSLYKHSKRKNRTVREALTGDVWIRDIAHDLDHLLLKAFCDLWCLIDSLHLDLDDTRDDEIFWILESSGQYSATSAYNIQFAGQIQSNFPKLIWQAAWAPP